MAIWIGTSPKRINRLGMSMKPLAKPLLNLRPTKAEEPSNNRRGARLINKGKNEFSKIRTLADDPNRGAE